MTVLKKASDDLVVLVLLCCMYPLPLAHHENELAMSSQLLSENVARIKSFCEMNSVCMSSVKNKKRISSLI